MPLPKLSPLQSRLAASLIASITLLILYFTFSSPHFAYAMDVESIKAEDHNHERLRGNTLLEVDLEEDDLLEEADGYRGDFLGYDQGIIGRAPTANDPEILINNQPVTQNVVQGGTNSYSFLKASVLADPTPVVVGFGSKVRRQSADEGELRDEEDGEMNLEQALEIRQTARTSGTVFISINTCIQPKPVSNTTIEPPPQLQLYISQSESNSNPGPTQDSSTQEKLVLEGGAIMHQINATGDVFIGIYGEGTTAYTGVWNAQIAVSIDGYYHTFHNETDPFLYVVDTDSTSALLVSGNMTNEDSSSPIYQAWMNTPAPDTIFVSTKDNADLLGLQNSFCALNQFANIAPTANRDAGQVKANVINTYNGQPTQEFYVDGLTKASVYNIALGRAGNATNSAVAGAGGEVWRTTNFTTLSHDNCVIIYDLSFCSEIAYAVPGNPNTFPNATALAAFYDNATQAQYQLFQNALAQTPCETTSSAQYSLARNCTDCERDYKRWICSVSMPRCTDWSSTLPWLQSRSMIQAFPDGTTLDSETVNTANKSAFLSSSRNPNIDTFVQPGPYKEILPCEDLCYNIVQSCPAALSFACPRRGRIAFNESYGIMPDGSPGQNGQITCNYPGVDINLSADGSMLSRPRTIVLLALVVTTMILI